MRAVLNGLIQPYMFAFILLQLVRDRYQCHQFYSASSARARVHICCLTPSRRHQFKLRVRSQQLSDYNSQVVESQISLISSLEVGLLYV